MIVQVKCRHCRHEFDSEAESNSAVCPECKMENFISMPKISVRPEMVKKPVPEDFPKMIPCSCCGQEISREAWICLKCGQSHFGFWKICGVVFWVMASLSFADLFRIFADWILKQFQF